ncbi:MAG: phosphoribosylformylglycinamidine cyclo-ligase [Thermoplasmata archaeon]
MANRPRPRSGWTYAKSGVDRESVARSLRALIGAARYRAPSSHGRSVPLAGHYAGLVRVGEETIAITTDTVGTKALLAYELGSFEGIGEDAVAVNVNDLAAVGARTLGLVDVISCASPDPAVFAALGRGLRRGLAKAECALLGGETAVVPEIVASLDVGGTAIGFFPKGRRPVTGRAIRPGDRILGLRSSGFHLNGYTLIRRLVREGRIPLSRPRPGGRRPLGEELLTPSRIYCRAAEALADLPSTHGLAHISGGGVRNLARLHPKVEFTLEGWPRARGIFAWAQEIGGIADAEFYQTFNAGIGFVAIVAEGAVAQAQGALARAGYGHAREVGVISEGSGVRLPHLALEYPRYA